MNRLVPYLTFNGNCREAMTFYQACLGGKLNFQTVGESPQSENLPDKMKNCILLASLKSTYIQILATDMVPDTGLSKGNSISLLLSCPDDATLLSILYQLKSEERYSVPTTTHEGGLFAQIQDKFGVHWILESHPDLYTYQGESESNML